MKNDTNTGGSVCTAAFVMVSLPYGEQRKFYSVSA